MSPISPSNCSSSPSANPLAAWSAQLQQQLGNLFDSIDTSGSGTITKDQFEQAFSSLKLPPALKNAGADAVWAKLDPNGTGSVSKAYFVKDLPAALQQLRGHHHHHHAGGAGASAPAADSTGVSSLGQPSTGVDPGDATASVLDVSV